jgi:hypothetical protein
MARVSAPIARWDGSPVPRRAARKPTNPSYCLARCAAGALLGRADRGRPPRAADAPAFETARAYALPEPASPILGQNHSPLHRLHACKRPSLLKSASPTTAAQPRRDGALTKSALKAIKRFSACISKYSKYACHVLSPEDCQLLHSVFDALEHTEPFVRAGSSTGRIRSVRESWNRSPFPKTHFLRCRRFFSCHNDGYWTEMLIDIE